MREKLFLEIPMKGPRGKAVNVSDQKEKPQAKKICYKSQRVVAFSRFFKE